MFDDWINVAILICAILFILGIIGILIAILVVWIGDSIERHRDKKYGLCPLHPDDICSGPEYVRCGKVLKCFDCPVYYKVRDKAAGLADEEEKQELRICKHCLHYHECAWRSDEIDGACKYYKEGRNVT